MIQNDVDKSSWQGFPPRPSNGRLWVTAMAMFTLLIFVVPMVLAWDEAPLVVAILIILLGILVSVPFVAAAWYYPQMRYLLGPDTLTLQYGSLIRDEILLSNITSVRVRERLRISLVASFRFPGLALFDVRYIDVNVVRMYSTSASKRILLIDTADRRYGITPEDEDRFLDELSKRLDDPGVVERSGTK